MDVGNGACDGNYYVSYHQCTKLALIGLAQLPEDFAASACNVASSIDYCLQHQDLLALQVTSGGPILGVTKHTSGSLPFATKPFAALLLGLLVMALCVLG